MMIIKLMQNQVTKERINILKTLWNFFTFGFDPHERTDFRLQVSTDADGHHQASFRWGFSPFKMSQWYYQGYQSIHWPYAGVSLWKVPLCSSSDSSIRCCSTSWSVKRLNLEYFGNIFCWDMGKSSILGYEHWSSLERDNSVTYSFGVDTHESAAVGLRLHT